MDMVSLISSQRKLYSSTNAEVLLFYWQADSVRNIMGYN
jgi:hypothetical protein